jgi:hypothetical protein
METKITIICPRCQHQISIDEALESQIVGEKEKEYSAKLEAEKKKLWVLAQEKAKEKLKSETEKETKFLREEIFFFSLFRRPTSLLVAGIGAHGNEECMQY